MPSTLQENFEEAIQKTTKVINMQGKLCEFSGHPERTKAAQTEALVDTYRTQLRTVVAIFCLLKSVNPHGGWDTENEKARENLQKIAAGSNLDAMQIAEEFAGLEEEAGISKLRGMLSDIHTNCSLIAEQMEIEFNEEERDIN